MAKKNLINADMLLAKPRTVAEPQPTNTVEPPKTTEANASINEAQPPKTLTETPTEIPTQKQKEEAKSETPPIIPAADPLSNAPETATAETVNSIKKGLLPSEIRATFIVTDNILEKVKAIAYWERLNIKEVVQEAFQDYIAAYEKKNGVIKNIPPTRQK